MKKISSCLLLIFMCCTGTANAQIHPLAFGATNWYADYVGLHFEVYLCYCGQLEYY